MPVRTGKAILKLYTLLACIELQVTERMFQKVHSFAAFGSLQQDPGSFSVKFWAGLKTVES